MPDKAVPLFERLLQALSYHGRYVPEASSDAPFPNSRGGGFKTVRPLLSLRTPHRSMNSEKRK